MITRTRRTAILVLLAVFLVGGMVGWLLEEVLEDRDWPSFELEHDDDDGRQGDHDPLDDDAEEVFLKRPASQPSSPGRPTGCSTSARTGWRPIGRDGFPRSRPWCIPPGRRYGNCSPRTSRQPTIAGSGSSGITRSQDEEIETCGT
jgi:hypothetical protein